MLFTMPVLMLSLTWKQFEWLMDGLEIEQPKAIKPPVKK